MHYTSHLYQLNNVINAGFVTGASIPLFNVLFGRILDNLNGGDSEFRKGVNEVALIFTILGVVAFFSGLLQVDGNSFTSNQNYIEWMN